MPENTTREGFEPAVSETEKEAKAIFKGVKRNGRFGGNDHFTYLYKMVEGSVKFVKDFEGFIKSKKPNKDFLEWYVVLTDFEQQVDFDRSDDGVLFADENKVITVDPRTYLASKKEQAELDSEGRAVGKHFVEMGSGAKTRTTKSFAKKTLKTLSNKQAWQELADKNPEEYKETAVSVIQAIPEFEFNVTIETALSGKMEEAIKLGELMLNEKVSEIKKIDKYKKIIEIKNSAKIKEVHWQRFILHYKNIIFFDNVMLLSEVVVKKKDMEENKGSRTDFFMLDEFGYPQIIEIKRSQVKVIKDDSPHGKKSISSDMATAISQLMNYMSIFESEYSQVKETLLKKGIELNDNKTVYGILIAGGELKEKEFEEMWRQNRFLNRIRIITYWELINSLKQKLNGFKKQT